tara:strand:+ start:924 stop:1217 length:294 start_codon:yes stop_codon:yes gene_type:complete
MDYKTLVDWHCSGNSLDLEDLDKLEIELETILNKLDKNSLLDIAPSHICKACLLAEKSLWISCLAMVLDQLRPRNRGKQRTQNLFNLLCKKGLLIID